MKLLKILVYGRKSFPHGQVEEIVYNFEIHVHKTRKGLISSKFMVWISSFLKDKIYPENLV